MLWNALDRMLKKKKVSAVIIIVSLVHFIWLWLTPCILQVMILHSVQLQHCESRPRDHMQHQLESHFTFFLITYGDFFFSAFSHKVFYACSVKNTTILNLKVNHYCFVSGVTRYKNKAQMRKHLFQDNWSPSEVSNLYAFAVLPQIMSGLQWPNI